MVCLRTDVSDLGMRHARNSGVGGGAPSNSLASPSPPPWTSATASLIRSSLQLTTLPDISNPSSKDGTALYSQTTAPSLRQFTATQTHGPCTSSATFLPSWNFSDVLYQHGPLNSRGWLRKLNHCGAVTAPFPTPSTCHH